MMINDAAVRSDESEADLQYEFLTFPFEASS